MNANENTAEQSFEHTYPINYIESGPESEENVCDFEDNDICTAEELDTFFKHKYKIHDESSVTYDNSYVLSLAKDESFSCIAAGLSDGSVRIFEINSEHGLYIKPPVEAQKLNICGVRFLDETPNLLLVGTTNGLVRLLDLRIKNEVLRFVNIPKTKFDPQHITSFDRNSNSRLLVMGTVQQGLNVNLLFYDLRTTKQLFRYLESHQDDLTSLRFHPYNRDLLCSGSTDGLMNIFDVNANNEDDAILTTINTENSVHKVNWHKNSRGQDIVSCITHTNSFKAYKFDGDNIAHFDRLKITETIKRKSEANCNLIDCHSLSNNGMMLLTGCISNNGSVLRSCEVKNENLLPYAHFQGNHQIVRESIFDAKTNILITAGECGIVTIWTPLAWEREVLSTSSSSSNSLKMKNKITHKVTPY